MRTAILLTASCQLHPLRASWGRRLPVSLSWAQAGGSRMTGLSPPSSPSFLGPAFQVEVTLGLDPAWPGLARLHCQRSGSEAAGAYTGLSLSFSLPREQTLWSLGSGDHQEAACSNLGKGQRKRGVSHADGFCCCHQGMSWGCLWARRGCRSEGSPASLDKSSHLNLCIEDLL